jgi:simple sugar transport system substrate-binding protein
MSRPPQCKTLRIVLIALMVLVLSGCKNKDSDKDKSENPEFILGFSQIGAESAWRNCNTQSVKAAAADSGVQLIFSNAEQKQENQIKAIRSFIAYQVDVIAFVPIVADGWDTVLKEAKNAGIPVLVTDRKIITEDETLYAGFIGTDSIREGQEAGLFLLKKFEDRIKDQKDLPIRIIEITGTEGSSVAIGRSAGFREILDKHPEFTIIHSVSGDFLRSRGYELMNGILQEHPRIDAVYSHNDGMTLGLMDSLREHGIKPGKDIVIVTIDAEQAAIDALRAGEVNCVIECNPKTGPAIMDLARKLATGQSIPRLLYVDETVFYETDDLELIAPRGY